MVGKRCVPRPARTQQMRNKKSMFHHEIRYAGKLPDTSTATQSLRNRQCHTITAMPSFAESIGHKHCRSTAPQPLQRKHGVPHGHNRCNEIVAPQPLPDNHCDTISAIQSPHSALKSARRMQGHAIITVASMRAEAHRRPHELMLTSPAYATRQAAAHKAFCRMTLPGLRT